MGFVFRETGGHEGQQDKENVDCERLNLYLSKVERTDGDYSGPDLLLRIYSRVVVIPDRGYDRGHPWRDQNFKSR